jgi:hypothetical protein
MRTVHHFLEYLVCIRSPKGGTQSVLVRALNKEDAEARIRRMYPHHEIVHIA